MAIKGKAQLTFQLWSKKLNSGGLKHYKRFKEKSVKLILYKYIQVREAIRDDGKQYNLSKETYYLLQET